MIISLLIIVATIAFMWVVFPHLPKWARVGLLALFCVINIIDNDAFFAAGFAALAVWECYDE